VLAVQHGQPETSTYGRLTRHRVTARCETGPEAVVARNTGRLTVVFNKHRCSAHSPRYARGRPILRGGNTCEIDGETAEGRQLAIAAINRVVSSLIAGYAVPTKNSVPTGNSPTARLLSNEDDRTNQSNQRRLWILVVLPPPSKNPAMVHARESIGRSVAAVGTARRPFSLVTAKN